MRFPGFIGPSYTLQSVNVDCQRTVNLFPEINALGTGKEREVAALVPTPGLRLLCTLPKSPVRAVYTASNEEMYAVAGTGLYKIASDWTYTEIGTLSSSTGFVSMVDNGLSLVAVDGTFGYVWTFASTTFAQITDPDFNSADQVTYLDGYFIFNHSGTQQFFISELLGTSFDALDFASAEANPDKLVGLVSHNQTIFMFGSRTTEVFYDSGNADFPFERISGAVVDAGCAAAFSIARIGGSVFWIGGDETGSGIVYRSQGYQAVRISTPAIESVIRAIPLDDLSDARAYTYQQGGHQFYCLNLPGVDATWVYDVSTGFWHERTFSNLWSLERHRADCHALAHGENVVGDYQSGKLYALDPNTYTDNGTNIARIRTAPHFTSGLKYLFHTSFQLDMETGVGLDADGEDTDLGDSQGIDPQAMLQWSDDGGHTWSAERWTKIGKIGETKTRVLWRRLGSSRDRVYRIKITDPVKVVLLGAELGIEEGTA